MKTIKRSDQEAQDQPIQDQTGALAESARRHLAYERLARHAAKPYAKERSCPLSKKKPSSNEA